MISGAALLSFLLQCLFEAPIVLTKVVGLLVAVTAAVAVGVLWYRPALGISRLRAVELVIFAAVAAYHFAYQFTLPDAASFQVHVDGQQALVLALKTDAIILRWFALVVGYGLLIPNTWR